MGNLVISTAKAIAAAVAMYFSLDSPNAVKNALRNAPPVPIKPAKKPDKPPPIAEVVIEGCILNFPDQDQKVYIMRNKPKIICSKS